MNERSVTHATFVVERIYPAAPARVFAAWADPTIKARWFGDADTGDDGAVIFDFRVGGREISGDTTTDGQNSRYEARYHDIVPGERIVYAYDMYLGNERISVSLATIAFLPEGSGTRLLVTEQGAYLDGLDTPTRREPGIGGLLDRLGEVLKGP